MSKPSSSSMTDYERLRQRNIERNNAMMASLLLPSKASALFSNPSSSQPRPKKKPRVSTPPTNLRRSLRNRGLPPIDPLNPAATSSPESSPSLSPAGTRVLGDRFSFTDVLEAGGQSCGRKLFEVVAQDLPSGNVSAPVRGDIQFDSATGLGLQGSNVKKIVRGRISSVQFLPLPERAVVVAGDKFGEIGFWDADNDDSEVVGHAGGDSVVVFHPHTGLVSGIGVHQLMPRKIYSSSYEGNLLVMDIEKEVFCKIYQSDYLIYSLSLCRHDHNSAYFAESTGLVKSLDVRTKNISNEWTLHQQRINSVDFHPSNAHLMATSSTDGTACIWDIRNLSKKKIEAVVSLKHRKAVQSAYFSPNASFLATSSSDDTLRILNLDNHDTKEVHHNNFTGRWLSTFKAIWGWDDSYVFTGNMRRGIDVISTSSGASRTLESEHMTSIPCRFAVHPFKVGHLAGANAGGKVYLWTPLE